LSLVAFSPAHYFPGCTDAFSRLHVNDHDRFEVDVVVENAGGELIGIEVKSAASIKEGDLRGLKRLDSIAGGQFKLGVILYDGTERLPLGDRL
jgi:predicted AAA+ superfamily ATPase